MLPNASIVVGCWVAMCKEAIVGNKDMQRDLAVMAEEWRKAVVTEIGRERYDALSKQLGCDLAYAYIDHRMEQLMIEKMVKDRMPTSSADYIIRKAAQSSLFGLPYELNKSPLAAEIEAKGEAAYKPSRTEKAAGWAAGAGADVVAMGGIGSWATFAKFVGIDMVMNVGMEHLSKKGSSQEVCVEECISKGVFGTGTNVFASFRKQAKVIKNHENSYIKATNSHFKNKIPTSNITFMDWTKQTEQTSFPWNKGTFLDPQRNEATKRTGKYKDVPLIVAPGQEDEYLEVKARLDAEAEKEKKAEPKETPDSSTEEATPSVVQQEETALQTNENGWDGLLQSFGLNGFSDIGKNLGYVLAMLPDVLVGLFTGKTKSLNMDNSLLPLASIVAGDGIGPEISVQGVDVMSAVCEKFGHKVSYEYALCGADAIDKVGDPFPEATYEICKNADAVLFSAVGDPKFDNDPTAKVRPEQGLLAMRKKLGLFANIRPVQTFKCLVHKSPLKAELVDGADFLCIRELTGGMYFGEKYQDNDKAYDTNMYTRPEIERILKVGFEYAMKRRKHLTVVDKANVLASLACGVRLLRKWLLSIRK